MAERPSPDWPGIDAPEPGGQEGDEPRSCLGTAARDGPRPGGDPPARTERRRGPAPDPARADRARTRTSRARTSTRASLEELAESIRARGVLQPVVVRPLAGGRYQLVAGERRLRAARLAELDLIPAVVRHTEDWEGLDLALAENMAREDLNPVEEARACAMLVEDLGLTKEEVGRRVGRSRVAISNLIRLLALPEEVLELIESGAAQRGPRPRDPDLQGPQPPPRPRAVAPATRAGRCARPSAGPARRPACRRARSAQPVVVHPDLAEAPRGRRGRARAPRSAAT